MRSDKMREVWDDFWHGWRWFDWIFAAVIISWLFTGCAALSTRPTGIPGCPNRTIWSDSAQRCIAREGR